MENDDRQVGRLLTRREVMRLLGGASAALLVGCGPDEEASVTEVPEVPTLTAEAPTAVAGEGQPTVQPTQTSEAAMAEATSTSTAIPPVAEVPECVVRPELSEGPYFVDLALQRADIRSDPGSGIVKAGVPLTLAFNVLEVSDNACRPLPGAVVDVWHCDALGVYSAVTDPGFQTNEEAFLRGFQVTDEAGIARFLTIYPGWYPGRTVHIHFKIRTDPAAADVYEFTSQLFFEEELSDLIHAQAPYSEKGMRDRLNAADGIFNEQLVLDVVEAGEGYAATFPIALDLSDA